MADHKQQVDELALVMREMGLSEAHLTLGDLTVGFRKRTVPKAAATDTASESVEVVEEVRSAPVPEAPKGTPISSPMTGIYYGASSPSSPPFVREGDTITAGQVIGLIEAMKVFNEIPAPISGTVLKISAISGELVNPGDVLLLIG